ncbi:MAG: sulfoxide reductase heme-binding subunit YedZ [Chloroflexi bacterium]|nr:sulfoxide reductase heme-binding subunit YedZ [Chloroflexota bacterium]MBK7176367.1 sulfoxide reductase heme-binding subunit YedZ [Chloroflexota bacterium]MBK7915754.1 sulfoxide reductase heme-binding subunit YedZ [Chloroflexota bacterium]
MKRDRKLQTQLLRLAGHVGALIPLALLLFDWQTDGFGPDPVREITLRTGKAAIILLVASLAVTPLKLIFGWNQLHPLRRNLGLYAFAYVSLHLLTFVWLDYGLSWALIQEAIFEKWYALVGFGAFLILLPLALTSSQWSMKKLGKRWTKLHKWVYVAGILAALHYILLVKNTYTQPFIFASILAVLLLMRLTPIKQQVIRWRRNLKRKKSAQISTH